MNRPSHPYAAQPQPQRALPPPSHSPSHPRPPQNGQPYSLQQPRPPPSHLYSSSTASNGGGAPPAGPDFPLSSHSYRDLPSSSTSTSSSTVPSPTQPRRPHTASSDSRPASIARQNSGPSDPGGAGSVSRRVVIGQDGMEREETREERRARKGKERAQRGADDADLPPPPRPSRLSESSSAPNTALPPPPHSASSSSAAPQTPSTSSKSVLTIALQRAQSAVLLDSANNFPAAIAAYSQSVRLLKEVMARVEDGGREMERKLSTGGVREGESMDEYERRKTRYERKEKAKMDEARRLRVIHDTYEDRIRMLVQMGTPLPPNTILSPSVTSFASLTPSELPAQQPSQFSPAPSSVSSPAVNAHASPLVSSSFAAPEPSPALSQHSFASSARSAESTSTTTGARPPSMVYRRHRSAKEDQERASISSMQQITAPRERESSGERSYEGIGSAMLQESDGEDPSRGGGLGGGDILSPVSASSDSTAGAATPLASSHQQHSHSLSAELASHASRSLLSPQQQPPHTAPLPPPVPSISTSHSPSASLSDDDFSQPLHTAVEYASGWPEEARDEPAPLPSANSSFSVDDQIRRPSFASSAMRRGSSASAVTTTSEATLRIAGGGIAGGESMRRAASAQSASSSGTLEIRPRPSRSASLASTAMLASGSGSSQGQQGANGHSLVGSTNEGSISMRRNQAIGAERYGDESAIVDDGGDDGARPANIVVRAPSSERDRTSAQYAALPLPPPPPTPTSAGGGGKGSTFPGRLRALSQPGSKRPKLQSFDSEQPPPRPPLPPLLSAANRSASSHHTSTLSNGIQRKPSIPTPTPTSLSLNLPAAGHPNLGRSNSSSSISSASSAARAERLAHLNGGGSVGGGSESNTPTSSIFPHRSRGPSLSPTTPSATLTTHHPHPSHPNGVYLSTGLPSPPAASSPSSREATLSIPAVRRPFHLMRLLVATIPSSSNGGGGGGYLSEKLFVPSQIWTTQGGAKLLAIETKVRMLDLLSTGLDSLQTAGKGLLLVPLGSSAAEKFAKEEAARFGRELEAFEGLAEGVQSTLGKKLGGVVGAGEGEKEIGGVGVGGGKGARKGSTASFSAWSSKLSMSLNRVTNGVSLDSQATYVDAIAKVFKQAQCLDHHLSLVLLTSSSALTADSNPYDALSSSDRLRLERQLRKASEFFGTVICRFVMRDTGVLLDKYVKRGGAWLSGE